VPGVTTTISKAREETPIDVSVVIVSWNVRELLRGCIESVLSGHGPSVEVIVIDNASKDGSAEMVKGRFPEVDLVASESNLGFSRANNVGLERASGRYVFFLNPDTLLRNGTLAQMVRVLEEDRGVDMVGPRLVFPDGTTQPQCRLPTIGQTLFHALYFHRIPFLNQLVDRQTGDAAGPSGGLEVEAVSGAAMLARREVLNELRGFDDSFLYTCEDIDLCLRLRARGSRILYLADAEVVHFVGQSSAQASVRAGTMSLLSTGQYFERSGGSFQAWAFRLIVQILHMPLVITVGVIKTVLGRGRPDELRERLRFAVAVWRWRVSD
jgi:GT2 family glycosyltransferase